MKVSLTIDALPLFVEVAKQAKNPGGLPNVFPFHLGVDDKSCSIRQLSSPELILLLNGVYDYGSTVGNAMDESGAGRAYAEDFLGFIKECIRGKPRVLEIGAGRGYLAKMMLESGLNVTALEPGKVQSEYWQRYGVSVIPDMFPSKKAAGPYDLIVFYGVLEHIAEIDKFLAAVRDHLAPGGMAVLSVPDCSAELAVGDPSILLHEHFHYFSRPSLVRVLAANGFRLRHARNSGFGRCLYAGAVPDLAAIVPSVDVKEAQAINFYASRVTAARERIAQLVDDVRSNNRTLGVYCPGRALSLLPQSGRYRFFDDAPDFCGHYYPPFGAVIENRQSLLDSPPDELWIMSRTFGEKLKLEILSYGLIKTVKGLDEILHVAS